MTLHNPTLMRHKPFAARQTASATTLAPLAQARLAQLNERVTAPRVAVLTALLAAKRPLSHQEVEQAVAQAADRVTIYRVLDWLVSQGLAHRMAGEDRMFRYAAGQSNHGAHGHFSCAVCGTVQCLGNAPQLAQLAAGLLPQGAQGEKVELNISGRCARCAHGAVTA
jgi:Fur family transcriptional regulator, ferric uptake regulator